MSALNNRPIGNSSLGISGTTFSAGKQGGSGNYYSPQDQNKKKKKRPFEDEEENLSPPPIQPPFDMSRISFLQQKPNQQPQEPGPSAEFQGPEETVGRSEAES